MNLLIHLHQQEITTYMVHCNLDTVSNAEFYRPLTPTIKDNQKSRCEFQILACEIMLKQANAWVLLFLELFNPV